MPVVNRKPKSNSRGRFSWSAYSEEQLLDLRLCDLGLRVEDNGLGGRIEELYAELAGRGLRLRPPCWLSSEWFSPHNAPGIAIPFYLAHPRLKRLEYQPDERRGRRDAGVVPATAPA